MRDCEVMTNMVVLYDVVCIIWRLAAIACLIPAAYELWMIIFEERKWK